MRKDYVTLSIKLDRVKDKDIIEKLAQWRDDGFNMSGLMRSMLRKFNSVTIKKKGKGIGLRSTN